METKKQLVIDEQVNRIFVIRYGNEENLMRFTSYCTKERAIQHAKYLRDIVCYKIVEIHEINLWME